MDAPAPEPPVGADPAPPVPAEIRKPRVVVESIQVVRCPHCGAMTFWTEDYDDFERHHAAYPSSEVQYMPGIDVGSWRPEVEIQVKGRRGRIAREDLDSFRIYRHLCLGCRKLFFAWIDVTNLAAVKHYEEYVRPTNPPRNEWDEVAPKWGMSAFTPRQFVDRLKGIRNPMVRAAVARRVKAAGVEMRDDNNVDVLEAVAAAQPGQ